MQRKRLVQVVVIVLALVFFEWVVGKWADFMWFSSLEYDRVFWRLFLTRFVVGAVIFLVFFALFQANFWYLRRSLPTFQVYDVDTQAYEAFIAPLRRIFTSTAAKFVTGVFSAVFAFFFAVGVSTNWDVFQKFFYAQPVGRTDPILGQ